MTSPSKLIPLEEAERIVRYELTGWSDDALRRILSGFSALAVSGGVLPPAGGSTETPIGAVERVFEAASHWVPVPQMDDEDIAAARIELASLRSRAAERDSVVAKAKLADDLFNLDDDLDESELRAYLHDWCMQYLDARALSATADTTEEEKHDDD